MNLETLTPYILGIVVPIIGWIWNHLYHSIKQLNEKLENFLTAEETRALIMDITKPIDVRQELLYQNLEKIDKKLDIVLDSLLRVATHQPSQPNDKN